MRITRDYGLTSSKLEHDLLARLNRDIIVAHRKAMEKSPDDGRVNKTRKEQNGSKKKIHAFVEERFE